MTVKKQLLLVNIQQPKVSAYVDPQKVGSYMWGRRVSNYMFFIIQEHKQPIQIEIDVADVTSLQQQILEQFANCH